MASPITTTTEVAGPVNVVFQNTLLRNAKARCPYFTGSQAASIAEHAGSFTAKWRRYENLSTVTTALSEPTGNVSYPIRDAVQASVNDYTATLLKYGNHLLLNEEVDLINPSSQDMKLAEVLGINAGATLNELQRNIMEDNATVVYSDGTSDITTDAVASGSDVKETVNALQRLDATMFMPMTEGNQSIGSAPIRESFWAFTHFDMEYDFRAITGFQSVQTYAGQTQTAPGEFGAVAGLRLISTSTGGIDIDSGDTTLTTVRSTGEVNADLYSTVVIGKDAVGSVGLGTEHIKESYVAGDKLPGVMVISHAKGSAGAADPLNEISTAGWKAFHTGAILNPNWIRVIRSACTKPASYS